MKGDLLLIGPRAIREALATDQPIDKVWVLGDRSNARLLPLLEALKDRGVPYLRTPLHKLLRLAGKNHQGIVARAAAMPFAELSEVLIRSFEEGRVPLLLIADGCTDVRNLGAMARCAVVLGADALVLAEKKGAALGEDALRASAGALLHIPLCRSHNIEETFDELRSYGLQVIASTEVAALSCSEVDLSIPLALVVGSEGSGLSQRLLQAADQRVRIPTSTKLATLNLSTAAAILLYEANRQRRERA